MELKANELRAKLESFGKRTHRLRILQHNKRLMITAAGTAALGGR